MANPPLQNDSFASSAGRQARGGKPGFQIVTSLGFVDWLAGQRISLALTTYHVGGLILLGRKPAGELSIWAAAFDRSMGCATDGRTMWLATERMLWRMENSLADGQPEDGFDRVLTPRVGYTTGELDAHEVAVDGEGRPVFVNTRFSCLAAVDERFSFRPLWQPPFISRLAPEDRCHLSGLAMCDGRPKYVSMHARSDVADGWREFRESGGLVFDVEHNQPAIEGLSMPHSPRIHDGRLWLLDSGTGYLGFVDPNSGKFERVTFLPGYARGLAIHGDWAVIGLSKPRREHAFQGLPLEKNLAQHGAAPRCGLQVVDLKTGSVLHWLRIESEIEELFDVAVLPGVARPKALSFATSSYAHQHTFLEDGKLQRWTAEPEAEAKSQTRATPAGAGSSDMLAPRRSPPNRAKALNNLGLKHAEQGNLDDAEACFEEAVRLDPQHAGAANNLGNVLRQQGCLEDAVDCYRRALAADADYAKAYLNLGQTLNELGRLPEAGGCFRRALAIDPHFVEAGVCLGMVLKDQGKLDEATNCFQQALKLDARSWSAHNGLGLVHKERDEFDAAMKCYQAALAIEPRSAAVLANQGSLLRDLGRIDEALACYDEAIRIEPDCVAARHNRSMLLLLVGDCERGWPEYEWRWKQPLRQANYADRPRWDGSSLEGRTILLHAEQGLGDTIQFLRYVPVLAEQGGRVVVEVQPPLLELASTCPGAALVYPRGEATPPFDVQLPLLSLPAVIGTTLETVPSNVPYVFAHEQLVEHWRQRLAPTKGRRIGIAWQGNPKYPGDRSRSIPLHQFGPLAELPGATLFSLQQGFGSEQLPQLGGKFDVVDLAARYQENLDFANTAAVMRCLDLVVAPNTAMCHLAGALGVPVWLALNYASDWRFLLERDDSPWYPSMRIFRQPQRDDWSAVFADMAATLRR
ncbi:MAG: TIGR03032 family protein [Pirellulaceae bacterium]